MSERLTCKNCNEFLSCDLAIKLRVLSIQIKDIKERIRPTKPFQMTLLDNWETMKYKRLVAEYFNIKDKLLKCFRRRKWLYENKSYDYFTEEEIDVKGFIPVSFFLDPPT